MYLGGFYLPPCDEAEKNVICVNTILKVIKQNAKIKNKVEKLCLTGIKSFIKTSYAAQKS